MRIAKFVGLPKIVAFIFLSSLLLRVLNSASIKEQSSPCYYQRQIDYNLRCFVKRESFMLEIKITQQKMWLGKKEVFQQNVKQHTSLTNIVIKLHAELFIFFKSRCRKLQRSVELHESIECLCLVKKQVT